jgi:hypothetical protein
MQLLHVKYDFLESLGGNSPFVCKAKLDWRKKTE